MNPGYNVCIFWNEELCHYFVGLTCEDYSLTLDVDDFNAKIKDLTRGKLGLKFKGIKIIEDKDGLFEKALEKFDEGKAGSPASKIREEMKEYNNDHDRMMRSAEDPTFVELLKCVMEILNERYRLDSQGIFEFTKEIVDVTLGPKSRTKIYKKVGDGSSKRYIRCLVVEVAGQQYLIDVDSRAIRKFDVAELDDNSSPYIETKQLNRNWKTDPYDGR